MSRVESYVVYCRDLAPNTVDDVRAAIDALSDESFTELCHALACHVFYFDEEVDRSNLTNAIVQTVKTVSEFPKMFGCFFAIGGEDDFERADMVSVVDELRWNLKLPHAFSEPIYHDLVTMVANTRVHVGTSFQEAVDRITASSYHNRYFNGEEASDENCNG